MAVTVGHRGRWAGGRPGGRAARRVPGRGRRAVTFSEVVVVALVSAIVTVAVWRFLAVVVEINAQTSSDAAAARVAVVATGRLSEDLAGAVPCDGNPGRVPLRWISPGRVELWVDTDGDGTADVVAWELTGSTLVRTVTPGTGPCTTGGADPVPLPSGGGEQVPGSVGSWSVEARDGGGSLITLGAGLNCRDTPESCPVRMLTVEAMVRIGLSGPHPVRATRVWD